MTVTLDGWTDTSNRTYISATYYAFIDEWKQTTTFPYCLEHEGTATGEDLARYVEGILKMHGRSVAAIVTDCEPVGRILYKRQLTTHVGCACRRLQSSAGVDFTGSRVTFALSKAGKTIGRYMLSSQASSRLRNISKGYGMEPMSLIQDVPARWSSTADSVTHLVRCFAFITQPR